MSEAQPLESGVPITNVSFDANQLRSYQFEGFANRGVRVHTGDFGANAHIWIFKPDGSYYWSQTANRIDVTLPATPASGTWTVAITTPNLGTTGTLNVYFFQGGLTVSEGNLITTQQRPGDLPANGIDSYKFSGVNGNNVTFATTSSIGNVYIWLYRPNGTYQTSAANAMTKALTVTGTYTVYVIGANASANGAYTITMTTTPGTEPTTVAEESDMSKGCQAPPSVEDFRARAESQEARGSGGDYTLVSGTQSDTNGASTFAGNPINFDLGYKLQVATDYAANGINFTRIYRSDSTWTNNTVGTLWRHNYARTLSVSSPTASIVNGSGTKMYYTLTGGNWVPDDPSNRAVLKAITGGYTYTLPDNTVETYNSSLLLTRIAYPSGGAVNLGYNGSNQLTSVTNENGRQITLTYSSGRVATVVTPDGTFSYSYTSGNLTTVTRPDTKTTTYHYENGSYVNALTGVTDAKGVRYQTFGYTLGPRGDLYPQR